MPSSKKSPSTIVRCHWASNEFNIPYHDEEWGVPVHDDRTWFEFLILEGAQAGLSWDTILRKRARYRRSPRQFRSRKSRSATTPRRSARCSPILASSAIV